MKKIVKQDVFIQTNEPLTMWSLAKLRLVYRYEFGRNPGILRTDGRALDNLFKEMPPGMFPVTNGVTTIQGLVLERPINDYGRGEWCIGIVIETVTELSK
jgi:hypothetical protein